MRVMAGGDDGHGGGDSLEQTGEVRRGISPAKGKINPTRGATEELGRAGVGPTCVPYQLLIRWKMELWDEMPVMPRERHTREKNSR
ncbi:hypothetical protein FCM35_KLT06159 [Carex littledalei]|uniref:Uncharacterized protein n=1 Tax=Carex littledalei TaxID=544730 RepID=A0A833V8Y0_9POAL|nr:hypothetical protein FCM35_KLT06159 [Carex littledalei]